jgi:hypothetical protein
MVRTLMFVAASAAMLTISPTAFAQQEQQQGQCPSLPNWFALKNALGSSITPANGSNGNGGLGFNMWGTLVANDGTVCAARFQEEAIRTNGWEAV